MPDSRQGGCECCEVECLVAQGWQGLPNGTNFGPDWTQVAGGWRLDFGFATTTDTGAILIHNATHPLGAGKPQAASVAFSGVTNDKPGVIIGYTDANNYWFAEADVDSAAGTRVRIGQVSAGTEVTLNVSEYVQQTIGILSICYDGTLLIAQVFPSEPVAWPVTLTGDRAGVRTGDQASSTYFGSFSWSLAGTPGLACGLCSKACCEGDVPEVIKVKVVGPILGCPYYVQSYLVPLYDPTDPQLFPLGQVPLVCRWAKVVTEGLPPGFFTYIDIIKDPDFGGYTLFGRLGLPFKGISFGTVDPVPRCSDWTGTPPLAFIGDTEGCSTSSSARMEVSLP